MLLVCSGPDTYRATEKADELERLFREKYDVRGLCVERLPDGKDAVGALSSRAFSGGLFSQKLFFRGRGLLALPKSQWQALHSAFAQSGEHVIIVDIEEEPLSGEQKKSLTDCRLIEYAFPHLDSRSFIAFALTEAKRLCATVDDRMVTHIANTCNGDSWMLMNELKKYLAYPEGYSAPNASSAISSYDVSDAWVRGGPSWRKQKQLADDLGISTGFLSAVRLLQRIQEGATDGLHPFIVKKMSGMKHREAKDGYASVLLALFLVRAGFAVEEEAETIVQDMKNE